MKADFIASAAHAHRVAESLNGRITHYNSRLTVARRHGWEDRIEHYSNIVADLTRRRDQWYHLSSRIAAQAALIQE